MKARDYQQEAIDALIRYFFTNRTGNPVLVLPTGSGKSVIIALFIKWVLENWPRQRILMLTHVKELIEQNYEKLVTVWPAAPSGIYSASLNRKEDEQILYAGVQSIYKKGMLFEPFDLVLIDECHLCPKSGNGQYITLLEDLRKINPNLRVIGLSATPYRMDSGLLTEGDDRIFTDVAFDLPMKRLLDAGHLTPVVSKNAQAKIDLKGVGSSNGEYSKKQMQEAAMFGDLTARAVSEMVELGADRNCWLVFCSGVAHAYEVRDEIQEHGIECETLHGGIPKKEREEIIAAHKNGELKALTNCDVLTTGYDNPRIDMLGLLRATKSPNLYVQIVGRGMRLFEGKENCLVLDFGLNVERHGPVDQIVVKKKRKKGEGAAQGVPTKECPECEALVSVFDRVCPNCAYEFPISEKPKHEETASTAAILSTQQNRPEWLRVNSVSYRKHSKAGKPKSLKVTYQCGIEFYSEWILLEHGGYASRKAEQWWFRRANDMPPHTVDEALATIKAEGLAEPQKIQVKQEGKFNRITSYDFGGVQ